MKKSELLPVVIVIAAAMFAAPAFAHNPGAYDIRFIDAMTKHHQDGLRMARMAVDKGRHAELRQLAQKMIDDQQKEIDQMQSWRSQWAKDAPLNDPQSMPGMMPDGHTEEVMARLQRAASNGYDFQQHETFDPQFTEVMPMHHQGAITLARDALKNAASDDIKALARKIIRAQTKEQSLMRTWHRQWGGSPIGRTRMSKN